MKFKVILLTPERAEQLLQNNHPRNRAMKTGKIKQMIADIEDGNWLLTPTQRRPTMIEQRPGGLTCRLCPFCKRRKSA